ncbi:MAG: putative transmembrane sensor domain [Phormidesmis priestleyi Ana]|uniref:Putative transmembrane sensor domain n=1 Tax=Phormidesmis priestleyi Ana TaxID=1666911 RepID=A0A0P8C4Q4_9CYAN|nr:MAG: putative transmembrane sensor domain [Phormidesmis priestleyi Ana]
MGEILGGAAAEEASSSHLSSAYSNSAYPIRFTGQLPAAPDLAQTQRWWQQLYAARNQDQALRIHVIDGAGLRYSENDFHQCCDRLVSQFNDWLNTPEFLSIDRRLRTELERADNVQIILETTDAQMRKLPWHLWQLLSDYTHAELTFCALDWRPMLLRSNSSAQARILAVFGNHHGLDLDVDLAVLESLENTHVSVLKSPPLSHLHETLWQPQGWDIFFFAGHSQTEGDTGVINLNTQERLTIAQIKHALSKAIANGLKIAIFNSCDGLGLAQQLSDLQIPYVVVMREPVPDAVAQQFLSYLLTAFAEGLPFHLAMREARQRLSGLENDIPCASWLPIIWQNPTAPAIYWQNLHTPSPLRSAALHGSRSASYSQPQDYSLASPPPASSPPASSPPASHPPASHPPASHPPARPDSKPQKSGWSVFWPPTQRTAKLTAKLAAQLKSVALQSLAVSGIVLGIRAVGLLSALELTFYDQLMRSRPSETIDDRIAVIEISQETTDRYGYPIPDQPLTEIIDRINQAKPVVIGLDLHRARPQPSKTVDKITTDVSQAANAETSYEKFLRQVEETPDLFLVCFRDSEDANYGTPAQLPAEVLATQVGFSDIPVDRFDRRVTSPRSDLTLKGLQARSGTSARRQPLSYNAELAPGPERCQTSYSLSFQLAFGYLGAWGINPMEVTADDQWQLGPVVFKWLPQRIGGYQNLNPHGGQILLNYRTNQPGEKITFEQLMADDFDLARLQDKIVLIGYTSPVSKDYFETPYGPMAGLWIHAHMVSQMTSAVLDGRPLMRGLPQVDAWQWGDWLWIIVWSCGGGYVGWAVKRPSRWLLGLTGGAIALYGLCWIAIVYGLWLPLIPTFLAAVGSSLWLRLR